MGDGTMITEWWYDDYAFDSSDATELFLARLVVRDDGTAQILTDGPEVIEFENAEEANIWLVSEEYRRLKSLIEDFADDGLPLDPRIKAPDAGTDEDLARRMVIVLTPTEGPPDAAQTVPPTAQAPHSDYPTPTS